MQKHYLPHIMFDIDDTLVNSFEFDEQCYVEAVYDILGDQIDLNWGHYKHVTDSGILAEHLEHKGVQADRNSIHQAVKDRFITKIKEHIKNNPVTEIAGAADLLQHLKQENSVSVSIATGVWLETAMLKLDSAGINISDISIASSNDHYSRIEIMKLSAQRAGIDSNYPITYFGDAAWDREACQKLRYNFVLVGNRIQHSPAITDYKNISEIMSLLSFTNLPSYPTH